MSITMHTMTVPIYSRMLANLSAWLDRAAAQAKDKGYDPAVLLAARLYPNMLPFVKQVQIAADTAKNAVARIVGDEAPRFDDNETTIDALKERITRTVAYLHSVPAARFEGRETAPVSVPVRNREPLQYTGETYLQQYALPNFFFHVTTAYAILRHNGVEIGKTDYLGR